MISNPKWSWLNTKVSNPWSTCELLWWQRGAARGQDIWSQRPQRDLWCLLLCWEDDRYPATDTAACLPWPVLWCFTLCLFSDTGRVFYTASAEKFTFAEAVTECSRQGARLANTGQLYLAWQRGMDVCNAGWLGDRSVRYPINIRRPQCGGGLIGVRTVYLFTNQTGYPLPESRYDAFCYTGRTNLSLQDATNQSKKTLTFVVKQDVITVFCYLGMFFTFSWMDEWAAKLKTHMTFFTPGIWNFPLHVKTVTDFKKKKKTAKFLVRETTW